MNKRNYVSYLAGSYSSKVIALASTIIAVKMLSADAFGLLSHLKNFPLLIYPFVVLGINSLFLRILHSAEKTLEMFVYLSLFLVTLTATVILTVIFSNLYFGEIWPQTDQPMLRMAIFIALTTVYMFLVELTTVLEKAVTSNLMQVAFSLSSGAAFLWAAGTHNGDPSFFLIIQNIGLAVILLGAAFIHRDSIRAFFSELKLKRHQCCPQFVFTVLRRDFGMVSSQAFSACVGGVSKRIPQIFFANIGNASYIGVLTVFNQAAEVTFGLGWALNSSFGISYAKKFLGVRSDSKKFHETLQEFYGQLRRINFCILAFLVMTASISYIAFDLWLRRWNLDSWLIWLLSTLAIARYTTDCYVTIMNSHYIYALNRTPYFVSLQSISYAIISVVSLYLTKIFGLKAALLVTLLPGLLIFIIGECLLPQFRWLRIRELLVNAATIGFLALTFFMFKGNPTVAIALATVVSMLALILFDRNTATYLFKHRQRIFNLR